MHPPLEERRAALDDARNLFSIGFWDLAAIGATVMLAFDAASRFLAEPTNGLATDVGAAVVIAPFFAIATTLALWRVAFGVLAYRTAGLGRAALGLGIGFCLGAMTSPTIAFEAVFWLLLLFVGGWLITGVGYRRRAQLSPCGCVTAAPARAIRAGHRDRKRGTARGMAVHRHAGAFLGHLRPHGGVPA